MCSNTNVAFCPTSCRCLAALLPSSPPPLSWISVRCSSHNGEPSLLGASSRRESVVRRTTAPNRALVQRASRTHALTTTTVVVVSGHFPRLTTLHRLVWRARATEQRSRADWVSLPVAVASIQRLVASLLHSPSVCPFDDDKIHDDSRGIRARDLRSDCDSSRVRHHTAKFCRGWRELREATCAERRACCLLLFCHETVRPSIGDVCINRKGSHDTSRNNRPVAPRRPITRRRSLSAALFCPM